MKIIVSPLLIALLLVIVILNSASAAGKKCPPNIAALEDRVSVGLDEEDVKGDKGSIKLIQQSLTKLGYNPGPNDGVVGSKTRAAIRCFEDSYGLKRSGALTKLLIIKLESAQSGKPASRTTIRRVTSKEICESMPFLAQCKN